MTIHLRFAGHKTPAMVIEHVQYVEPLPDVIQYTYRTPEGVMSDVHMIDIRPTDHTFVYNGTAYDFLAVIA